MTKHIPKILWLALVAGCAHAPARRVGMAIQLKPECLSEHQKLHADSNPGVREPLGKYHMHNFSIYLQQIDGKYYEFGYYEYRGTDFEGGMAQLAREPRNIKWPKVCDPMQMPLPGSLSWTEMKPVYFYPRDRNKNSVQSFFQFA